MRLTAIEVHGFKSFAHKTRLEFGEGVTAIVGPNGSGKSNMAEAVRWVLGEQSLKSLRGKASTDVIFSGSSAAGQARRARVALTFDNESGRFPLPVAEVVISRVLGRDGESEYQINGEAVRLLDLQQMLAEAGIGAKSYTVISQGMVDRYLTATPQGRQELFDEATGVRALQLKMQQAEKKLTSTREQAHEVQVIMNELEPRLRVLERQVKRQQQRDALVAEFTKQQRLWLQHSWQVAQAEFHQAEAAAQALTQEIAEARARRQQVEAAVLAAAHGMDGTDELRIQLERAQAAYATAMREYQERSERRAHLTASLQSAQTELAQAETVLAAKRNEQQDFDWLATVRSLLQQCREALQGNHGDGATVLERIDSFLTRIHGLTSVDIARSVLDEMEVPLQAVARGRAILEERQRQLDEVPELAQPSDASLVQLRAAFESQQTHHDLTAGDNLEEARDAELRAEREGSAARAALSGSHQALIRIEQDILREIGSSALAEIQASEMGIHSDESVPTEHALRTLQGQIAALGEIDELALREYNEVRERFSYLQQQMQDIHETEQNVLHLQAELAVAIQKNFNEQFVVIAQAFSRYFEQLFHTPLSNSGQAGKADLRMSEAGIEITVAPPGKRARSVTLLSGGEKALTSLALLLAIIEAQEPPFIMLDEVDAALDEANSERLAHILHEKATRTQCIVISHNRSTMAVAQVLYGVTMQQDGISKIYSVRLHDIALMEDTSQAVSV